MVTAETLQYESELRGSQMQKAAAGVFLTAVRSIARCKNDQGMVDGQLQAHLQKALGSMDFGFTKAAVDALTLDDLWHGSIGSNLANAYLASIRQFSLLDLIAQFAMPLPPDVDRLVVASGAIASVTGEAQPKAVRNMSLTRPQGDPIKAAAIIVFSKELALATSNQAGALFARELQNSLVAAFNASILSQLTTTSIAATGSALGDLKAGIAAAEPSYNYVVAAGLAQVRELAFSAPAGFMGIAGGEFLPGIHVVPVAAETSSGATMTIIAADRMAVKDYGLTIRNSSHASLVLSDAPTSPGQMTSMWQTNCISIVCERSYQLLTEASAVEVG